MAEHRADVVKDIKDVPQVSLEYYESYILPPSVYSGRVEEIIDALKEDGVYWLMTKRDHDGRPLS